MALPDTPDAELSHLTRIVALERVGWDGSASNGPSLIDVLERGDVLFFPNLRFEVTPAELQVFSPAIASRLKNVSFDVRSGRLGGTNVDGAEADALRSLL